MVIPLSLKLSKPPAETETHFKFKHTTAYVIHAGVALSTIK